jgi:hypothetical protein
MVRRTQVVVPGSHMYPVPHAMPPQQGSPAYPQGVQVPSVQLFGETHGYGYAAGFVQQISPRSPHAVQVPDEHARLGPHASPAQHGWPSAPHPAHIPPVQLPPA